MSRLLLLLILVVWMCPRDNVAPAIAPWIGVPIFILGYVGLVALIAGFSRLLARRVGGDDLSRLLRKYNRATELARYLIPLWFGIGIFMLGWGNAVHQWLGFLEPANAGAEGSTETYWRTPGLIVGTFPALAAWAALWWAQFPADRALKEQNLLYEMDQGLPVHAPPRIGVYLLENFRVQMALILVPMLLIVLMRDAIGLGWLVFAGRALGRDSADILMLPMIALVYVLAPEVLRRVIHTEPLPPHHPLRRRLELLCQRTGLKCRDILLWRTQHLISNAMVMGMIPQVRYIFLSDLLIETMTDEEIEAVFAHEMGHIVHKHLWWYAVFMFILMFLMAGPVALLLDQVPFLAHNPTRQAQLMAVLEMAGFWALFGMVSRRFESQADVFAARTMQQHQKSGAILISHVNPEAQAGGMFVHGLATANLGPAEAAHFGEMHLPRQSGATGRSLKSMPVGEYGAAVVAAALHRVARINNIPVAAHEWLHGSIDSRARHLVRLSGDQNRVHHFDRSIRRLKWGMLSALVALAAWFFMQYGGFRNIGAFI